VHAVGPASKCWVFGKRSYIDKGSVLIHLRLQAFEDSGVDHTGRSSHFIDEESGVCVVAWDGAV
jgi:hypothetical protein